MVRCAARPSVSLSSFCLFFALSLPLPADSSSSFIRRCVSVSRFILQIDDFSLGYVHHFFPRIRFLGCSSFGILLFFFLFDFITLCIFIINFSSGVSMLGDQAVANVILIRAYFVLPLFIIHFHFLFSFFSSFLLLRVSFIFQRIIFYSLLLLFLLLFNLMAATSIPSLS